MANVSVASRLVAFFLSFFFFSTIFVTTVSRFGRTVFSSHSIRGVPRWWKKGEEGKKRKIISISFPLPFFPLRVIVRYAISILISDRVD